MDIIYELMLIIPILLISLSIHEFSHGYVSYLLGDPTPKAMGRLTLNPLAHLDPMGSLVLILTRRFGWAKPVPINPNYYNSPKKGMIYVGIAGPASNFVLAVIFSLFARGVIFLSSSSMYQLQQSGYGSIFFTAFVFFRLAVIINISLGLFNLLPVPPLDGSKILFGFLPSKFDKYLRKLEGPAGMLLLLGLAYTGILWGVLGPAVNLFYNILL